MFHASISCCCVGVLWPFEFMAVHFGCSQLAYQYCSLASLLGSLRVLCAHAFASNWQLPFLNQRKEENGYRNYFMTKLHERMLPDMRIEPATVRIRIERTSDRATASGASISNSLVILPWFVWFSNFRYKTEKWHSIEQKHHQYFELCCCMHDQCWWVGCDTSRHIC